MSLPNRSNPYSFDAFVAERDRFDYYADDRFLREVVARYAGDQLEAIEPRIRDFSVKASTRWRKLAETASEPDARPRLTHFDGHGNRIDRIVRPLETVTLEREVFAEGLFTRDTPPWERFTKMLLLHQNSEAGVMCPLICTEGFINLVGEHLDGVAPEVERMWRHCKEGIDGDFGVAAQYLSEIQGGSELPANLVEAVSAKDGSHRLYGVKFFCSACQADYAIVTAKVSGSDEVSTFAVPSWLPGDEERERRNGQRIRKLKVKLGTVELPTAEIEYDGAVAYQVGPIGKGVRNVVGHVLTLSRLHVGSSCAGGALRAVREAKMYADFRQVFGVPVSGLPLSAAQLVEIERTAQRMLVGAFELFDLYLGLGGKLTAGLPRDEDVTTRRRKMLVRIAIMLQKIVTTRDSIELTQRALGIYAGHGIMMDFTTIPRLMRDALVNEQWEGPRALLLHQIHHDLGRVTDWYPVADFVSDLLRGGDPELAARHARALERIIAAPFTGTDAATLQMAGEWDALAQDLFHAFQQSTLDALVDGARPAASGPRGKAGEAARTA